MRFPGTKLDMGIVGSALAVCGMGFVCLCVLCVSLGCAPERVWLMCLCLGDVSVMVVCSALVWLCVTVCAAVCVCVCVRVCLVSGSAALSTFRIHWPQLIESFNNLTPLFLPGFF